MAETDPEALVAPTTLNGTSESLSPSQIQPRSQMENPVAQETSTLPLQTPMTSATTHAKPSPAAVYPVFVFPSQLPVPPFIDVSGIPNFRSLGGYLSANGQTIVKPDLFYRCAHPTQVTPEGLEQLTTTLNVKAIYDLRSGPEVARTTAGVVAAADAAFLATNQGAKVPPSIPAKSPLFQSLRHFTPVYATEDSGPDALARKLSWYTAASEGSTLPYSYSQGFVNAYRDIATHGAPAYTMIFRHILTRPSDPFVFHCTAGKDRTGVFAALVLRLAGVDDETICWEYAVTEAGLGAWRNLFINRMSGGAGLQGVSEAPKETDRSSMASYTLSREEAARVCGSRAGNMRAWLTLVLDGEWGGAEKYLMNKCEFTEEEVMEIKRNIVVDVATAGGEEAVVRPCPIDGWSADGGVVD